MSVKNSFSRHRLFCGKTIKQRLHAPEPGTYMQFKNYKNSTPNALVYYCDFETLSEVYNVRKGQKNILKKRHIPVWFGIMRRSIENPTFSTKPHLYLGKNVVKNFIRFLEEEFGLLQTLVAKINHPISMTAKSRKMFKNASHCALCDVKFTKRRQKMRDHSHLKKQDNFRAALCSEYNLNRACIDFSDIPVIFHGLGNFDGYIILADLYKATTSLGKIPVVPHNTERYLSFTLGPYKFIDSFKFLPTSLKVWVHNLKTKDPKAFVNTRKLYGQQQTIDLLLRKQPYPYAFPTKLFDYNYVGLPNKFYFRNELGGTNERDISDDDYNHAKLIYSEFGCKSFLDFHKLYLALDVVLLGDVFEIHRKLCLDTFGLDVTKYLSNANYSFDAFLKRTKIQLELFSDVEMYCMIESGIQGSVSVISKKYACANNKYMGDIYDTEKTSVFLWYVDAINLYGHAMSQTLPVHEFQWVNGSQDVLKNLLLHTANDSNVGYIACVDLNYP